MERVAAWQPRERGRVLITLRRPKALSRVAHAHCRRVVVMLGAVGARAPGRHWQWCAASVRGAQKALPENRGSPQAPPSGSLAHAACDLHRDHWRWLPRRAISDDPSLLEAGTTSSLSLSIVDNGVTASGGEVSVRILTWEPEPWIMITLAQHHDEQSSSWLRWVDRLPLAVAVRPVRVTVTSGTCPCWLQCQ